MVADFMTAGAAVGVGRRRPVAPAPRVMWREQAMRGFLGKLSETFQARRSARENPPSVIAAGPVAARRVAAPDDRALNPRQGLAACQMAAWSWDLASDQISWGPTARAALGFDRRRRITSGKAWAGLIAPGSGETRAEAIAAASAKDQGDGVPFRCRYVIQAGQGLCLIEERGRWHAGPDGRPARAEGIGRVVPIDGRHADPGAGARRLEPARDVVTRTLAAMLHDPGQGLHALGVAVCQVLPAGADVVISDPGLMDAVAAAIARRLRRTDVVARLDPGQFAVILNGCDERQGRQAAIALARNVERACTGVTAHVGLVAVSARSGDAGSLLERACEAARLAADAGEMLRILEPRVRRRAAPRLQELTQPDVVALLNGRDIALRRRPLVELGGDGLRLEEAVPVAACVAGKGFMGRGLLAPVATSMGLSGLLDQRMLELVVRCLAADPEAHLLLRIAATTLSCPEWRGAVAAWLAAHPGVSSRLVIALDEADFAPGRIGPGVADDVEEPAGPGAAREVTGGEKGSGLDPRAVAQHLSMMKALGVSVGVAGYGHGWLDLDHLSAMAVDVACLSDLFAVESLSVAGSDRFIVRALAEGARDIGVPVVAPAS